MNEIAVQSFGDKVAANWDGAFAVALRILANRESARDVAQEATCLALRHEARFDRRRGVRPWLLTIARNVALNEVHRRSRYCDFPALFDPVAADSGIDRIVAQETCVAALHELPKLRPAYRRALELKCRGYRYRDIALALSVPVGTAQTHVHRAQRELRARCTL